MKRHPSRRVFLGVVIGDRDSLPFAAKIVGLRLLSVCCLCSSVILSRDVLTVERRSKMVRIFVGGLGEVVTTKDLHWLFGSLGSVKAVETT